jgi:trehalose-phosphatase
MSRRLFDALPELSERLASARQILLIVDFQGALIPIPDLPDEARLPAKPRDLLRALVKCSGITVAIISGREREDLSARVDVPGATLISNHGLEISGPGMSFEEPTAAQFSDVISRMAADFVNRLQDIPGAVVERKGLSLTIQYRLVPEERREELRRTVHSALANASHPFLLRESGRLTYEVRPRAYWNKGSAVTWMLEHLGGERPLAIYVGDDNTDEDAFAVLSDGITVKVGEPSGTAAQYHVESPREVHEFLAWVLERLTAKSPAAT